MKNKLSDLNNHLFAQLERLGDEGLTDKDIERELKRTSAITSVAKQLVSTGNLAVQAKKVSGEYGTVVGTPLLEKKR